MAASHTTNLNLNKPARTDFVSVVSDINDNMDIIDEKVGAVPSGKNLQSEVTNLENETSALKSALSDSPFRYVNLSNPITANRGESISVKEERTVTASFSDTWGRLIYYAQVAKNTDYLLHANLTSVTGGCYFRVMNETETEAIKTASVSSEFTTSFNTGSNSTIALQFGSGGSSNVAFTLSDVYLLENDNLFVDDTLTKSSHAADAKKTGNEISGIKTNVTTNTSDLAKVTTGLEQDEFSAFTKDGNIFHIPKYRIPYQSGTRYIYKSFYVPVSASHEYYISVGNVENGLGVRISYADSNKDEIAQTGVTYNTSFPLERKDSPSGAAYMNVTLYAIGQQYAESDGVAIFTEVNIYSSYGKAFTPEANKGINSNGLKIDYNGRSIAWFFKDEINVYRDVSNQYTDAYIYDSPDFSSYTGVHVEITSRSLTNVKGKYILLYFTGTAYDSVRVDYTEQVQTDARDLNFLININKDKYCRFFWFTDSHADYRNPIITDGLNRARADAKFIADNILMDFVLHCGDIVMASQNAQIGSANGIRFMSKELKEFGKIGKLIYAVGNHDGLNINNDDKETTLYSIGYDYEKLGKQYFYFDNHGLGLRFVVMANPDDNQYGPDKPQLDWLSHVALNTNYNVVITMHITPINRDGMYNITPLANIMKDFNDKTSGTGATYWGSGGKPGEQLEPWDFSNSTGGKVMVVLGGHTHRDIVLAPNETDLITEKTNPFPCYLVQLRNTFYEASQGDVAYSDKAYAYDVAVLNLTTGYLNLHRRGNGSDRDVPLTM